MINLANIMCYKQKNNDQEQKQLLMELPTKLNLQMKKCKHLEKHIIKMAIIIKDIIKKA